MKKFKYKINGKEYEVAVNKMEDTLAEVEVNGTTYQVELEKKEEEPTTPKIQRPVASSSPAASKPAGAGAGAVKSPLPGIIISIPVSVGDTVTKGQTVVMLEAMKMENAIQAPIDGKVTEISVAQGDSVLEGVVLLTIA
ncbi:biotin/lipoyl-containing protein [Dysgonomonas sp. 511]|uniref:biotin/lipoyl-containing protein n=1 Tax=Dysgonomonas sp. 511 TaxID=2302930 RepID=UPI0013D00994|nr:biotin/lipoyl-containing protein [Dysgonomonas sp. 511]NDV79832.1 biotin/lipoyl-binding protein [Dysgonomonas sp. 511]